MRTLYFEGAGWDKADVSIATIGNCRCRTAFKNDEGKKIYLEISVGTQMKKKIIERYWLHIDFAHYITNDPKIDDCNNSRIHHDWMKTKENYDYSIEDITKWINKNLHCSFDNINVLSNFSGYRVHGDNRGYNMIENYIHNKELIEIREDIHKVYYELEKSEGKEFPNFSLWVDEDNVMELHLLRHYNGYNKHWTITINSSLKSWIVNETLLGKYAC